MPKRVERDFSPPKNVDQEQERHVGSVHLGLCVVAVSGVLLSSFYTVFPLVVRDYMVEMSDTGNYLALMVLSALLPLLVVGHIADRYGRANTVVGVAVVMLLSLSILALKGSTQTLWGVGWIYSGLIFCVYGLAASDVNDHVSDQHRERAAAAVMLLFSLGGCAGPWLSGWAYSALGATGYFVVSASAAAMMWVAGIVEAIRRCRIHRLRREAYWRSS
jgi:MFS family permease